MQILEIGVIPVIVTIVYTLINLIKVTFGASGRITRFYPLIAMLLGIGLGILTFYLMPSMNLMPNLFMAIVAGGASGLSATGFNQVIKKLSINKGIIVENNTNLIKKIDNDIISESENDVFDENIDYAGRNDDKDTIDNTDDNFSD